VSVIAGIAAALLVVGAAAWVRRWLLPAGVLAAAVLWTAGYLMWGSTDDETGVGGVAFLTDLALWAPLVLATTVGVAAGRLLARRSAGSARRQSLPAAPPPPNARTDPQSRAPERLAILASLALLTIITEADSYSRGRIDAAPPIVGGIVVASLALLVALATVRVTYRAGRTPRLSLAVSAGLVALSVGAAGALLVSQ